MLNGAERKEIRKSQNVEESEEDLGTRSDHIQSIKDDRLNINPVVRAEKKLVPEPVSPRKMSPKKALRARFATSSSYLPF